MFKLEFEWRIDLPNQMKLEYENKRIYIDGSVRYYVFTTKDTPQDAIFTMGDDVEKEVFEGVFSSALNSFGVTSGNPNIPEEYIPNLNEDYQFIVLSGVTSNRFKFLYVVYEPSSQTIYICHQIAQYSSF